MCNAPQTRELTAVQHGTSRTTLHSGPSTFAFLVSSKETTESTIIMMMIMMMMMMMWTILELSDGWEKGEKCEQITQKCIFQLMSDS